MTQMTAIEHGQGGGPEVLVPAARPVPVPGPGEVLVKVTAAGVNGPDLMQRRGLYPPPKGASDLLGLEVSGEIVGLGEGATRWEVGDRICALTNGGGYADCVTVLEGHCLPLPPGVPERDAAGLPETYFTVWSNFFHHAAPPEGGLMLVHGGAGGIGSTAIQLGAALGLRVFATEAAGGLDFCRGLGAERAIDYASEDFVEIVRAAGGADLILDIVGGPTIAKNIKAARHDARIVNLAYNAGSEVTLNMMPVMLKRLVLTGSTLRSRPDAFKAAVARELEDRVWPLFGAGRLKPVTHTVLPLAEAAEAHRLMESAGHRGKILLTP
ncbi:NAD(P)H-quinone oxidoreductase [Paralimibaculum aggregatum]|uniref:NAD(P)H-quinone oxidoreductase n=2 Tax=Paralimibaculum aggregatum TaxID=3036245 RepID=A0ABQ6LHJ1_9RHOB|nr:NAD(P)H-quinone oxidoreductase [Limibaculum sp. NKW23]GMG82758.1 NAD(P)H-quinone oxidoreductase [Limibaculum sp. NKW23]